MCEMNMWLQEAWAWMELCMGLSWTCRGIALRSQLVYRLCPPTPLRQTCPCGGPAASVRPGLFTPQFGRLFIFYSAGEQHQVFQMQSTHLTPCAHLPLCAHPAKSSVASCPSRGCVWVCCWLPLLPSVGSCVYSAKLCCQVPTFRGQIWGWDWGGVSYHYSA